MVASRRLAAKMSMASGLAENLPSRSLVNELELGDDVERDNVTDQLVSALPELGGELGGRVGWVSAAGGGTLSCRTSKVIAMATTPSDKASRRSTPGRSPRGPAETGSAGMGT
jgi:hypothetical protein